MGIQFDPKVDVIAVDGTSGSGKGTFASRIAQNYEMQYLDTGKMYRAVTHAMLWSKLDISDGRLAAEVAEGLSFQDLSNPDLIGQRVSSAVAIIARHQEVRKVVDSHQQRLVEKGGIVMDGRDIGTTICPQAKIKFYIMAELMERSRRRHAEYLKSNRDHKLREVYDALADRDYVDATRTLSPLVKASDAKVINTTYISVEQMVALGIKHISGI